MEEVDDVGNSWAKTFDMSAGQAADLGQPLVLSSRVEARSQECREGPLIGFVLINVGNPEFGLPVKGVGCSFKHLLLFCNGGEDDPKRRPPELGAECSCGDTVYCVAYASSDRAEGLHPVPAGDEPCVVAGLWI